MGRPRKKTAANSGTFTPNPLHALIQFVMLQPLAVVQQALDTAMVVLQTRIAMGLKEPALPLSNVPVGNAPVTASGPLETAADVLNRIEEPPPVANQRARRQRAGATMPAGEALPLGTEAPSKSKNRGGRPRKSMVTSGAGNGASTSTTAAPVAIPPGQPIENLRPGVPLPETDEPMGELGEADGEL